MRVQATSLVPWLEEVPTASRETPPLACATILRWRSTRAAISGVVRLVRGTLDATRLLARLPLPRCYPNVAAESIERRLRDDDLDRRAVRDPREGPEDTAAGLWPDPA